MKKSDMKILERMFAHEVERAVGPSKHHYPFQTRSKRMIGLEMEGYVKRAKTILGDRFPVEVSGWELTQLGRLTYCASCD